MKNPPSHSGHMPASTDARALAITGWLTGIYFLIELGIGLWTGSISVISDAFHTFSAVGGVLIALVAGRFAQRKATDFQTFGLIRAEIVGALFNGLFLAAMAFLVLWMGAMRLMQPIELPTGPMLAAALGGLITECISMWLLLKGQKDNLNMKGAFWHVLQTFVGSIIIIISALVIRFTGFLVVDPLLGMAFGLVLFWASWGIIRDSLNILLQRTPKDLDIHTILDAIHAIPGIRDVHHIHAWSLTSSKNVFSAHLVVEDSAKADGIRCEVHDMLKERFGMYFSTLQTETDCTDAAEASEIDLKQHSSFHPHS
ncbi:zinc ABC transporter [Candidatus Peregrinibacteria bacterium CG10_big_fil_rev_8_21_14_0_10_49_24]|nr:MAG: zinc ABC transporter [Candidatus Peregrinibacteria bacterium CG11_big_fil_rev_8_21_14_0_20_49_14]PIR51332.1 MAG: zinc ABC transporter [Candidatus Peregrinibacteria bacterium CG10_big_fil_rev_8_21_14_0_10_49_24]PJA68096.1 MAG: zinc ABC transporter [Candidatus Peregrinibacteria bacterium CG_4_9_14_3_um_filter_49_12]